MYRSSAYTLNNPQRATVETLSTCFAWYKSTFKQQLRLRFVACKFGNHDENQLSTQSESTSGQATSTTDLPFSLWLDQEHARSTPF